MCRTWCTGQPASKNREPPSWRRSWKLSAAILHADYTLNTVTRESGGRLFCPKTVGDLAGIYTTIAQELFTQYELGYTSAGGESGKPRRRRVRWRADWAWSVAKS